MDGLALIHECDGQQEASFELGAVGSDSIDLSVRIGAADKPCGRVAARFQEIRVKLQHEQMFAGLSDGRSCRDPTVHGVPFLSASSARARPG